MCPITSHSPICTLPIPISITAPSDHLTWCLLGQHARAGAATRLYRAVRIQATGACGPAFRSCGGIQPSRIRQKDEGVTAASDTRKARPHGTAQLLGLRRAELDDLFARSDAGPVPDGAYSGTVILPLDAAPLRGLAAAAGRLAWRGKVFDAGARRVINRVLPFGVRAVAAEVRRGPSRLDGRECIVLDYSRTSLVARGVRDELRLLRPGLYLGRAYWHGLRVTDFALEFG